MNEVSGISTQSILQELNKRDNPAADDNGEADFLKLLVAQLNNQNPLSPQENGEFLAQLAQFSTVEGVERLNATMDSFTSSMVSNQALQATALVGRSVQIDANVGQLTPGYPISGAVDLPASSANLSLSIFDASGVLVRQLPMGAHSAGKVNFSWDGLNSNGDPMPAGQYVITADASLGENSEQASVFINANVNSVTMGTQGRVVLNLEGSLGSVALNDVLQIN